MSKLHTLLITSAAVWAVATPAGATIIMADPSSFQGENVLFGGNQQEGTTVVGATNTTNTSVTFDGLGATLRAKGGQSFITGALDTTTNNPNDTVNFSTFSFGLTSGATFNDTELSLFGGNATSVNFTVTDNTGATFNFIETLGNGQNRFGFQGIDGESIASISFTTNGTGIERVDQVRLMPDDNGGGGVGNDVPEPDVWALLMLGFGLTGVSIRRRRTVTVSD